MLIDHRYICLYLHMLRYVVASAPAEAPYTDARLAMYIAGMAEHVRKNRNRTLYIFLMHQLTRSLLDTRQT